MADTIQFKEINNNTKDLLSQSIQSMRQEKRILTLLLVRTLNRVSSCPACDIFLPLGFTFAALFCCYWIHRTDWTSLHLTELINGSRIRITSSVPQPEMREKNIWQRCEKSYWVLHACKLPSPKIKSDNHILPFFVKDDHDVAQIYRSSFIYNVADWLKSRRHNSKIGNFSCSCWWILQNRCEKLWTSGKVCTCDANAAFLLHSLRISTYHIITVVSSNFLSFLAEKNQKQG